MNKKGFTLIEILAVIVIIGIIGVIGIASVSNSTEKARKASFATSAKTFIESARSMRVKDDLPYDPKNGELLLLKLDALNGTDIIDNFKTEYGDLDLNLCYVVIVNDNYNYQYYITLVDSTKHNILKKEYSIISEDSVNSSYSLEDIFDMNTATEGTIYNLNSLNYTITSVHDSYIVAKLSTSSGTNQGGTNQGGTNQGGTNQNGAISLVVTTKNTNKNVSSDEWVNEGLNYILNPTTSGNMYYCYDRDNSCTPNILVQNNELITSLNEETGTYYFRYKIDSRTGIGSKTQVFKAKVDVEKPICTFGTLSRLYVNRTATIDLTCTDSESNLKNVNLPTSAFSINNNNLIITGVSKSAITNGIKYTLTLKGLIDGNSTITLKTDQVYDNTNNSNDSTSVNVAVVGVFKVTLDNQGAATAGTPYVYEQYNVGWYSNNIASIQMTSIAKPTKVGYTFKGYYTGTNGSGTQIINENGGTINSAARSYTNDGTAYAKWMANPLIFNGKTITKTWSTSAQSETFTAATNGAGPYVYTEKSEKNSSGTATSYISVSGTTITIAGSTPVGTYTYVVAAKDNTTGATKDATFTIIINKAASSITCANKTYNGSSQSLVSSSSGCGSISNGNQTNAGTYTVTCNGDSNHNNSTCTGTINKVNATLSCVSRTYNGSSQTIATCSGGTLSNHNQTNAGSYTVTCTGDSNHNTVTKSCSINKKTTTMSLSSYSGEVYCTETKSITVTTDGDGAITCSVSDYFGQCSISGNKVTIFRNPQVPSDHTGVNRRVTISQAAGLNYTSASQTYTVSFIRCPKWFSFGNYYDCSNSCPKTCISDQFDGQAWSCTTDGSNPPSSTSLTTGKYCWCLI